MFDKHKVSSSNLLRLSLKTMKKPLKRFPEKHKYKDIFSKKISKKKTKNSFILQKGKFGLKSLESFKMTFSEAESLRKSICFYYKSVKVWFNLEFNVPLKSKSLESRMGKGKGKLQSWVCTVKKGAIFLELDNLNSEILVKKVLKIVSNKLQVTPIVVKRF